ncbi:hypothetical protein DV738_g700, partial [Chaetothyriales sp. CBS 135597]
MTATSSTEVVLAPSTSVQSSKPDTVQSAPPTFEVSGNAPDETSKIRILGSLLWKFVGTADFSAVRFSLPAQLIEPIPNLGKYFHHENTMFLELTAFTQFVDRPDAFVAIGQSDHELGRMLEVIRFWLTKDLKYIKGKPIKPYNSVLGEFFRCNWEVDQQQPLISLQNDSLKESQSQSQSPAASSASSAERESEKPITVSYITEQTSHHPPISAYYIDCPERGIHAKGYDQINAKFAIPNLRILPGSYNTGIHVSIDKHKEDYQLTHPTAVLAGIFKLSPYILVNDSCFITCSKTKLKAILTYDTTWMGENRVNGVVYKYDEANDKYKRAKDVPDKDVLVRLEGVWQERVYYWFPSGDRKTKKNGPPADKRLLIDLVALTPTPKIVPPLERQLPNESRRFWKDLTIAIQERRYDEADIIKKQIEQRQRDKATERNKLDVVWKPRFFAEVTDDSGQPHLSEEGKALLEAMSFGFSPADIKELLKLINWVHGSLREEGGSRDDFQSLDQVQTTLQQVLDNASSSAQTLTVSDADRDSLLKAVDLIRTRASSLSAKQAKFGKKFSSKKSASWHREILTKLEWMLDKDGHRSRQKDLLEQVNILSSQLNISGLKTVVQKVDEAVSLNEKLHNAHRDGAQSNKLELGDLIQTTGQKNQEITLRTSAGLLDRLAEIAAEEQQFRGKLESELSSLQSTTFDSGSDISRTRWRLKDFHDDINQHMKAVMFDARVRTRLMNSIRDDVADLQFRISQSIEQPSTRKETTVTPVSVPWIVAAVGVMVIHRNPQGQEILLKVSQAGIGDPISCLLAIYILFALYQLLRTRFLPRLTQSMSIGADCVFFQDPWGKMMKVPFSICQDPRIMDDFAEEYIHARYTIGQRWEEDFHWFTGPSEDSIVTWKNWQKRPSVGSDRPPHLIIIEPPTPQDCNFSFSVVHVDHGILHLRKMSTTTRSIGGGGGGGAGGDTSSARQHSTSSPRFRNSSGSYYSSISNYDDYDTDVELMNKSTLATACTTPEPDRDFDSDDDDETCNQAAATAPRHDPRYPPGGWSCSTPLCWGQGIAYGKRCGYCGFEAGVVEAAGQ